MFLTLVDSVLIEEPLLSPSPNNANSLFQQFKEEIIDQIPDFLKGLSKLQKRHTKSMASSPQKKRKNSAQPDPTSSSEEEPSDEELRCIYLICVGSLIISSLLSTSLNTSTDAPLEGDESGR